MDASQIVESIRKSVNEADATAEVFLFGSRARGDNQNDSDWDLLILVDHSEITNDIEDKFRDRLYDIELESGQIISTFIYPKKVWQTSLKYSPLYKNITREGIQL